MPRVLTEAEYGRLREVAAADPRSRAIVELFLQTGIRLSEAAALTTNDVANALGLRQVLDDVCPLDLGHTRYAARPLEVANEEQLIRQIAAASCLREVAETEVAASVFKQTLEQVERGRVLVPMSCIGGHLSLSIGHPQGLCKVRSFGRRVVQLCPQDGTMNALFQRDRRTTELGRPPPGQGWISGWRQAAVTGFLAQRGADLVAAKLPGTAGGSAGPSTATTSASTMSSIA